jgi:hypothetical protein
MKWLAGGMLAFVLAAFVPGIGVVDPRLGTIGVAIGLILAFVVSPIFVGIGVVRIARAFRR